MMRNWLQNAEYAQGVRTALQAQTFVPGRGAGVLVTGATGLIGSSFVDLLLVMNDVAGCDFRVYAAARDPVRVRSRFGARPDVVPVVYDASKANDFDFRVDFIVHAASNASPDKYMARPVETMVANFCGLHELFGFARRTGVRRLLYVSSSEVYGLKEGTEPFRETDYGRVDVLNVRSSYAEAKRATETLAVAHAAEGGTEAVIVRPGHVYGPTALESDMRVSSLFARMAAEGRGLVMKSDGRVVRSYCHCLDCATAILTVLLAGRSATAYNVSNPASVITIRQMAELMAKAGGVPLEFQLPTDMEKSAFNPMTNASLDASRLLALGWKPVFSAEAGIASTVRALKEELR